MYLYIYVSLQRFCCFSPSPRTTLLLHSWLPHPSQLPLGLPPARALGRGCFLGAPPPVLPGSCWPQLRSCRRYWGRTKSLLLRPCVSPLWQDEGVARRLSPDERFLNLQSILNQGLIFYKHVYLSLLSLLCICVWAKTESYASSQANSEEVASLKGMIILLNILIIIIQGTFQRRLLTTEEKMTLWS